MEKLFTDNFNTNINKLKLVSTIIRSFKNKIDIIDKEKFDIKSIYTNSTNKYPFYKLIYDDYFKKKIEMDDDIIPFNILNELKEKVKLLKEINITIHNNIIYILYYYCVQFFPVIGNINIFINLIKELNDDNNTFVRVCCNKVIDYDNDIKIIDYTNNAYSSKNKNNNNNYDCGRGFIIEKQDNSEKFILVIGNNPESELNFCNMNGGNNLYFYKYKKYKLKYLNMIKNMK